MITDELFAVLPKPPRPSDPGSPRGWQRIDRRLASRLPVDFVFFINTYGTGTINDYLSVLSPFSQNPNLNLLNVMPEILAGLRHLRREEPESLPYPLYFEPGGLLPWGLTDNGEYLCWQTTEFVDLWPVVVVDPRNGDSERFELAMCQVLVGFLNATLRSRILPMDVFLDRPTFTPSPPTG